MYSCHGAGVGDRILTADLTGPELIRGWPARFDGGAAADRIVPVDAPAMALGSEPK